MPKNANGGIFKYNHSVLFVCMIFALLIISYEIGLNIRHLPYTRTVKVLEISAEKDFQSTNIEVSEGQYIHIKYLRGMWAIAPDMKLITPDGYPGYRTEWSILRTANLGSLIMRIGNGDPIEIGLEKDIIADRYGELTFQVNDGNCQCNYDNRGSIVIQLETK